MNNKAHLRPKDFDSNGDIIPMACKEEKGDLISREALKEQFTEGAYTSKGVREIIDNAPAVDMNTELSVAYLKGRRQGQSEERPQGEWIFRSGGYYKCNKCGEVERAEKNFCPNCGAKMKAVQNEI